MKGNTKGESYKICTESDMKCVKIIEFDYLKRFEHRAGRTIKSRKSASAHGFLSKHM